MKQITGSISYTLNISDTGEWTVSYGTEGQTELDGLHNDIASLVIAQHVMEQCAVSMKHGKESLKGRDKKYMTQKLDKVVGGRFGLKLIADYLIDCYPSYIEFLAKKEAKLESEDKLSDMEKKLVESAINHAKAKKDESNK